MSYIHISKTLKKSTIGLLLLWVAAMLVAGTASATPILIAGVDFEGSAQNVFDISPDDYAPGDGITVSSGSGSGVFDGWSISLTSNGSPGTSLDLRNDNGANSAGATSPNFPARMEGGRTLSWSITIDSSTIISLDRIEFDARGATSGATTTRGLAFRTSLDGSNLWENSALIGRTATPTNWENVVVDLSGPLYQNLTHTTVSFIWSTTGGVDIDTINVYASVVPEPSTALLLGLGLFALIQLRFF